MSQKLKAVTPPPWQSNLDSTQDRLTALYENSKLSDLTITFPGHEDVMQVHRLLLALNSPVFEAMFYGSMAQKENLSLPDDPPEAFRWLLKYMYSGSLCFPSVKMAVQVYHLAKKYQMDELASSGLQYLERMLTADTLPEMYDTFLLFENTRLLDKCRKMMLVHSSDVLNSPHIGQFSLNSFHHVLQQKLNISSEVTVFSAILSWSKAQLSKDTEGWDSLRQVTEELLVHVRFLTMTPDELTEHVLPTGILTPEETSAILMNIKNVKNVTLPVVFSRNNKKRKISFDESFIRTITIKANNTEGNSNYQGKVEIVKNLTVSRKIDLHRIVDHGHVFYENYLVVISCGGRFSEASSRVINHVIEFEKPVTLDINTKYVITAEDILWESDQYKDRYYSVEDECFHIPAYRYKLHNNHYEYSGKDGNVTIKGDFVYVPKGLTFHCMCFDN